MQTAASMRYEYTLELVQSLEEEWNFPSYIHTAAVYRQKWQS